MQVQLEARGELIELRATETESTRWIQVAKTGSWKGHVSGPFAITEETLDEMVANFNATENRRVPFDFEHASETDPTSGSIPTQGAPAQGWVLALERRGTQLWGLVEWLALARDYIKNKQYRYLSPTIRFGARDRVTGKPIGAKLTSVALTNQPFLDGMQPLAASDKASTESTISNSSGAAVATDLGESAREKTHMSDPKEAENATLTLKLREADATVAALKQDVAERDAIIAKLKESETKRLESAHAERVELAFSTYQESRRLSELDKKAMLIVLKSEPETFEGLYPKVKPTQAPLLRSVATLRDTSPNTVAHREPHSIKALTDKFVKEGQSLEDAISNAFAVATGKKAS